MQVSDSFDEDTVKSTAEQVVTYASDGEYASITDMVTEDYKDELSEEVLEHALGAALEDKGAFQDFKSETIVGNSDEIIALYIK